MSDCISQEILDRFIAGTMSPQERQQVQAHLETCAACRRRVDASRVTLAHPKLAQRADSDSGHMPEASKFPLDGSLMAKPLEGLLENYQIIEELPRGGQALVYKAIHKPTKMKVALKVLLPSLLGSAKARQSFEREVELAASLNHPNIVKIHDSGISRGQYFFSMEYIHGRPLDEYIQAKAFTVRDKIAIFAKICDAMTCAHQHGVIHRDLKPSNILVDDRGEPHVVDFGLAKAGGLSGLITEASAAVSLTGEIKGTVNYMSPEQAEGRPDLVDVRSDVYSLGVLLYQLLTGRFPYDVSGPMVKVLENIRHAEPVRPRQIVTHFDSDVEAIVLKCLAKDRSQRYQSAAELHHDLTCWLAGLPIVVKSVSSLYLLRKIVQRNRYTSLVVTLLVVIVISFAFVSLDLYKTATLAQQETEKIAAQWERELIRQMGLNREVTFIQFLEAFHAGRMDRARWIANFLGNATNEGRAVRFLLDPNLPTAKEKALREAVTDDPNDPNSWLVDLVVGEDYLKRGLRQEAVKAYQRSYRAAGRTGRQSLLYNLMKARLYESTAAVNGRSSTDER